MGVPRDEGLQAAVQVSPEHVVDSPEEPHRGLPVKLLFVRFTIFFTKETPDTGSKTLSGLELLCPLFESAVVVLGTINHMLVLEAGEVLQDLARDGQMQGRRDVSGECSIPWASQIRCFRNFCGGHTVDAKTGPCFCSRQQKYDFSL